MKFGYYALHMSNLLSLSVLDTQLLHQLGDRLQRLRKGKGLGTVELAEQVRISRPTLRAVEAGDPNTSIGTYLRVMSALGIGGELAMLASDAMAPTKTQASVRRHQARPPVTVTFTADPDSSALHDLQSLSLHAAGMELVKRDDEARIRAIHTVSRWLSDDPTSRSAPLWLEWKQILLDKRYRKVMGRSSHSQQLRQASPIPTLLPQVDRLKILEQMIELKNGVKIDHSTPGA